MPGDVYSLSSPAYWLSGLAIFGAGVWVGRAVALRLVPPGSWRQVAGMALIFAGILALPFPSTGAPKPTQTEHAAAQQAAAVVPLRVSVVIARTNLAAGAGLSSNNVELRDMPVEAVQPNAATTLDDVLGRALTVPVAAGEQILMHRLTVQVCAPAPVFVTVTVDAANVRSGPSVASSVIDQLKYGTELQVIGQSANWLKVQLPDRREGWVSVGWVTQCAQPGQPTADLEGAQIIAAQISPTNTKVGDTINVTITVKNASDKPLKTMGPEPGYTYVQGQTYFTQQYASDPGKWRVAIGTAGVDATELPYRWGLGGDLAPGATTTVIGHIKVTQDFKTTNFWAALVNEPSTVVQAGVGKTLVTSLPENLAIVAVDSDGVRKDPTPTPAAILPGSLQAGIMGIDK